MTDENPLRGAGAPLSSATLAKLEAQLGAPLPDNYRRFLLRSNGGTPAKAAFSVETGPAPAGMAKKWRDKWEARQERWVDQFFTIDDHLAKGDDSASPETLAFWRAADWAMLPPETLPIAAVTRDDILLLYLRGPRKGEVHLRCDEYLDASKDATPQDVEAAIRFVARSFDDFFNGLHDTE
jgi:hypothetical protein